MKFKIIFLLLLSGFFSTQIANAQCKEAGHSANEKDSWLSCQTNLNPNTSRGESHWLLYGFFSTVISYLRHESLYRNKRI